MSIDTDRKAAAGALDDLLVFKGQAQRTLNAQANALRAQAKNETDKPIRKALERQANEIARQAIALNRENLRILHVRNRILKSMSLAGALNDLRKLTEDAQKVVEHMKNISESIGAVTDLISIIVRFSKLVV